MANEFVARKGVISLGGVTFPYYGTSVDYTGQTDDYFIDCISSGITITLPDSININGKLYVVKNSSNGVVTVRGFTGETLDAVTAHTLASYNSLQASNDGDGWKIMQVGGAIKDAGDSRVVISDGTTAGVKAYSGLTYDGYTLKLNNPIQDVASQVNYGVYLTGITVSGGTPPMREIIWTIPYVEAYTAFLDIWAQKETSPFNWRSWIGVVGWSMTNTATTLNTINTGFGVPNNVNLNVSGNGVNDTVDITLGTTTLSSETYNVLINVRLLTKN